MIINGYNVEVLVCHKIKLNSQGYTSSGVYFGVEAPLYYIEFKDGRSGHVRACNRDAAIKTAIDRPAYWGIT